MYTIEQALKVVEERIMRVALQKICPLRGFRLRRLLLWKEVLHKLSAMILLISLSAFSAPYTYRVDTSSTNLAATFPTGAQLAGPSAHIFSVDISNGSSSEIEVNCSSVTQPSVNAVSSIYVPASSSYSSPINSLLPYPFAKVCWIRSVSGTISSGVIEIVGWGE